MNKPLARDYKRTRRTALNAGNYRDLGMGLAIGLGVAVLVFAYQESVIRDLRQSIPDAGPQLRAGASPRGAGDTPTADPAADNAAQQFDFYEMLPKFEVVVPEKEQEVGSRAPMSTIERPGTYALQVGTYRRFEDAERVRQQLALQSIAAGVQRVAVDNDVWHRVRVGPLTDLAELNRLRGKLRSADLDALVIRLGE